MTPAREWFVTLRIRVARAGVGFALLLGVLGSVMTFVPGYQAGWFGVAAAGALTGMLSPNRWIRVLAVALAVCLAGLSWDGYLQGRRVSRTPEAPVATRRRGRSILVAIGSGCTRDRPEPGTLGMTLIICVMRPQGSSSCYLVSVSEGSRRPRRRPVQDRSRVRPRSDRRRPPRLPRPTRTRSGHGAWLALSPGPHRHAR